MSKGKKEVFFSIMIPVYNGEKLVSQAIDSVINQPYPNIELIIMNDGSTDSTQSICESYVKKDSRIKLFSHENTGLGKNRNMGFEHLSGRWTIFLDHDDMIIDNFLTQELVDFLCECENNDIDLIIPARIVVDYEAKRARKDLAPMDMIIKGGCESSWNVNHEFATLLYRTDLLMQHNIRFHETKPEMESIFRHKAAYLARKVLFSNKFFFGVRRENPESITNRWNYLNTVIVSFKTYMELERWHYLNHANDPEVYREAQKRTVGYVLDYIIVSLRQNIAIKDIIYGLTVNDMRAYVKSCLKKGYIRNKWMISLAIAPRFCLYYLKNHLSPCQPVGKKVMPNSFESFIIETESFPDAYSLLLREIKSYPDNSL